MNSDMATLLEAVCHSDNIAAAVKRYQKYRGLWTAGKPMPMVARDPLKAVLALTEELRSGSYRPEPPHRIAIAKANGERRELRVYAIRDRVAQRAVLQVLQRRTEPAMSACSFGYRPGRSTADAGRRACRFLDQGLIWVVKTDIEHCFDSIPRHELLAEVVRRLGHYAAAEMVARCLGWHNPAACHATGLPQGSVLAPWLCNIYLWHLDEQMRRRGTAMVRFADDLVLFAANRQEAKDNRNFCAKTLRPLKLRLHPRKTRLIHAEKPFCFLGQRFMAPLSASNNDGKHDAAFYALAG